MNPYTPAEFAIRLLPFLHTQDVRVLATSRGIHALLQEEAWRLLAARGASHAVAVSVAASHRAAPKPQQSELQVWDLTSLSENLSDLSPAARRPDAGEK